MSSKLPASTEDWLFSNGYWSLDTDIYHSAPSSLRSDSGNVLRVLCNVLTARNMPNGRIESWFYKEGNSYTRRYGFCCRNQYPTWSGGYEIVQEVYDGIGSLGYYIFRDEVQVQTGSIPQPPFGEWFKRRLTFWESAGWFIMRFEKWDGSQWVKLINDYLDANPLYGSAAQNRCGIHLVSHPSVDRIRADDTVIYKPS